MAATVGWRLLLTATGRGHVGPRRGFRRVGVRTAGGRRSRQVLTGRVLAVAAGQPVLIASRLPAERGWLAGEDAVLVPGAWGRPVPAGEIAAAVHPGRFVRVAGPRSTGPVLAAA